MGGTGQPADTQALIRRLRAPATGENTRPLRTEAADALDAVAAELAEWQRRNETLTEDIRNCNQRSRQLAEWLAATREALGQAIPCLEEWLDGDGNAIPANAGFDVDAIIAAGHAALAGSVAQA